MSNTDLNRGIFHIKLRQGVASNVNTTVTKALSVTGEPLFTTDTKKVYIYDGSNNVRIHGLDLAAVNDGEIVTNEGEIVWIE